MKNNANIEQALACLKDDILVLWQDVLSKSDGVCSKYWASTADNTPEIFGFVGYPANESLGNISVESYDIVVNTINSWTHKDIFKMDYYGFFGVVLEQKKCWESLQPLTDALAQRALQEWSNVVDSYLDYKWAMLEPVFGLSDTFAE